MVDFTLFRHISIGERPPFFGAMSPKPIPPGAGSVGCRLRKALDGITTGDRAKDLSPMEMGLDRSSYLFFFAPILSSLPESRFCMFFLWRQINISAIKATHTVITSDCVMNQAKTGEPAAATSADNEE